MLIIGDNAQKELLRNPEKCYHQIGRGSCCESSAGHLLEGGMATFVNRSDWGVAESGESRMDGPKVLAGTSGLLEL